MCGVQGGAVSFFCPQTAKDSSLNFFNNTAESLCGGLLLNTLMPLLVNAPGFPLHIYFTSEVCGIHIGFGNNSVAAFGLTVRYSVD